ncbi:MAG: hypothetical protein JO030_03460 [Candidatus Eremiobacteraeota bacterium]|nr:hypothetical protein [Candidatus Eremiobacteraeota bacterium]
MKIVAFAVLALLPLLAIAQVPSPAPLEPPASAQELATITERGRALYDYDQAAWHGTDAARAVAGNDTGGLGFYIAFRTSPGWVVDFGALDSTGKAFITVLEAQSADGVHFTAGRLTPPRNDTGFLVAAAHAIRTAEAAFSFAPGYHYNVAVLPRGDGTLYVYLYPAHSDDTTGPAGGDERFTISADGAQIVEAHRMHRNMLTRTSFTYPRPGAHLVSVWMREVIDPHPQDSDVFLVLSRKPRVPEYVNARGQLYLIQTDGTIEYQGPAETTRVPAPN